MQAAPALPPSPISQQGTPLGISSPHQATDSENVGLPLPLRLSNSTDLPPPAETPPTQSAGTIHDTPKITSIESSTPMMVAVKRGYKFHVPSACIHCKQAHLACDVSRPCKRCISVGKADTCQDVKQKKRGRPRLQDVRPETTPDVNGTEKEGAKSAVSTVLLPRSLREASSKSRVQSREKEIAFVHESFDSSDNEAATATETQKPFCVPEPPPPEQAQQQQPAWKHGNDSNAKTITLFLSLEVCCARASDEVSDMWGYTPEELTNRSLYTLISHHDTDRLARLHRMLLDNIVEMQRHAHPDRDGIPPAAEPSVSRLFHDTEPAQLLTVAHGASSFVDTVHIKSKSGDQELYQVLVYLGGGLGGNLSDATTLSKLYIVAELKKHEFKVKTSSLAQCTSKFGGQSVLRATKSTSSTHPRAIVARLPPSLHWFGRSSPVPPRQGSLPGHFTTNAQLNTVSLPKHQMEMPKVNVAPMTGAKHPDPKSSSGASKPHFRPIAAHPTTITNPSSIASTTNPYAVFSRRLGPAHTSCPAPSSWVCAPSYTHPTTQYFLQTSSSTLNAAASTVQGKPSSTHLDMAGNDKAVGAVGKTQPNRKSEMSIRSLLS